MTTTVHKDVNEAAAQITRSVHDGSVGPGGWIDKDGTPLVLTYGFRATPPDKSADWNQYPANGDAGGFQRFNAAQMAATEAALAMWADVANITFNRVDTVNDSKGVAKYAESTDANLLFANFSTGAATQYSGGWGGWQWNSPGPERHSNVWMNSTISDATSPILRSGGNGFSMYLHEIGHAITLDHPGDYNAAPGTSITYEQYAEYVEDSQQYTVMSYFDETSTGAKFGGVGPMTPMIHDIAAVQLLYGANMTARTGDSIYGFNSNVGSADDPFNPFAMANSNDKRVFAVWDAGGNDTFDFSRYIRASQIDLHEGAFSSVGGLVSNVSIAFGAVIENAIGGLGNDTITGNDADNSLKGGTGSDTIIGAAGNDTLDGNLGNDILTGGDGEDALIGGGGLDAASYKDDATGVTVDLAGTGKGGEAEGDTFTGIVNLIGGSEADELTGNDSANVILGGKGDDALGGGKGNDRLDGGEGDDTVDGGLANDTLMGGANTAVGDTLSFAGMATGVTVNLALTVAQDTKGAGKDTVTGFENLTGGGGDDRLIGDSRANVIEGGAGDDVLVGGAGNDTLDGGAHGAAGDTVSYGQLTVAVTVDLDNGKASYLNKVADHDTLSNIENAIGGTSHDTLTGDGADNVLEGALGNDTLTGGAGKDTASYASAAVAVTVDLSIAGQQSTVGAGKDTLAEIENLLGSKGNDLLLGDGNDNTLNGGLGNDTLIGGAGKDTLIGGGGIDTASYKNDTAGVTVELAGGSGVGTDGEAEGDTLTSIANITGGSGNDSLTGDDAANVLIGGGGNDLINGGLGDDKLTADGGLPLNNGTADTVAYTGIVADLSVSLAITKAQTTRGAGKDTLSGFENLTGGFGNDMLFGDGKDNVINGSDGDDILNGGLGDDMLNGASNGALGDTASFAGGAAVIADLGLGTATGQGIDLLQDIENLTGSGAIDTLTGDSKDNVIEGGLGNDILSGGVLEIDEAVGDTASYAGAAASVTVDLSAGTASGGAGKDTLANFENILGGKSHDLLTGDADDNTIDGGFGNDTVNGGGGVDTLIGGTGHDTLIGGDGVDTLTGGAGNDLFRYNSAGEGGDDITDLSSVGDKISILKTGFGILSTVKVGGAGANSFAAHYFVAGAAATEAGHGQFLFDDAADQLLWDDDGTGVDAAVLIATLTNGATIDAADFELR